jgi:hypothetical protein
MEGNFMKSRFFGAVRACIIAQCLVAQGAFASLVFVSGDSNIGNAIDGPSGAPVNANNATWFTNILGGGTTVKIQNDDNNSTIVASTGAINTHYNSLGSVTSNLVPSGTLIDDALLSGVDLYINILPSDNFTIAELNSLSSFVSGGGSLFLLGENGSYFTSQNTRINSVLGFLGSSMNLLNTSLDSGGFNTTSNLDVDPFNSGVSDFTYASTSSVSGGTSLIRTIGGETFIAYEELATVPVPAAVWLFGSGLLGLIGIAKRKKA